MVTVWASLGIDIENLIRSGESKSAAEFLYEAKHVLDSQAKIVMVIPRDIDKLESCDGHLRAVLDSIKSNTQSRILISKPLSNNCSQVHWSFSSNTNTNFEFHDFSSVYLMQDFLQKRIIPFSLGRNKVNCEKEKCYACNLGKPCIRNIEIPFLSLTTITGASLDLSISCLFNKTISLLYEDYKIEKLKNEMLAAMLFEIYKIDFNFLHKCHDTYLSSQFLREVNKEKSNIRIQIFFTVLRALCLPSSRDRQNAHPESVDWHPESAGLQKVPGVTFYRADVLPLSKKSPKASGTKRISFCRDDKSKKWYILAYTNDHDFSLEILKSRWNIAKAEKSINKISI